MIKSTEDELAALSPLLTYVEAGRYLRKGARYVRNEVYEGRLAIKRLGRTPYIHRDELDRYLADHPNESGVAAQRPEMTPKHKLKAS